MIKILFILLALLSSLHAHRIITLTPSLSEIVADLAGVESLVGVSSYASYPPEVKSLPQIGGYFSPSLERIYALRPTLVIGQVHHRTFLQKLDKMGIKTLTLELNSLKNIQKSIKIVAKALFLSSDKSLAKIKKALAKAQHQPKSSKKILITYGVIKSPKRDVMFIAGQDTFYTDIINACGAKNAFSGHFKGQPKLSFENLIALNPDQVIMLSSVLTDGHPDKKAILQAWSKLPIKASQNHNIHILDEDYLLIPSQRVASTIATLCKTVQK